MALQTNGLSHVAIRVTHLARAKQFYTQTLGFAQVIETPDVVLLNANGTMLGLRGGATGGAAEARFDPYHVGLDHLALAVSDAAELTGLQSQLDEAGVPNNGVEHDQMTGASYISFYDPDGIAWEMYAMLPR